MKQTVFSVLLAILFLQISVSALSCKDGYYDPGSGSYCLKCLFYYTKCKSLADGTIRSSISGYKMISGTPAPYCMQSQHFYNAKDNTCDPYCATGCSTCAIDNDFCLTCDNGFVWNADYTCLPSVLGLEAASLALLVISLAFLVIAFIQVNKARK